MAGYWPGSYFACLWTKIESRSINSQEKEGSQYPATLTKKAWSIKDLLFGFLGNFSCGISQVVPNASSTAWVSQIPKKVLNATLPVYILVPFLTDKETLSCTPNANMADNLVGAQDESYESEVSQALMFCFDNAFPRNILLLCRFRPFCFSLPMRFCVPECICYEERVKPSTAETVFFIRYPVCLSERVLVKVGARHLLLT